MKKRLIFNLVLLLIMVFAISIAVYATSASYNINLPLVGHKTVASGTKSNTTNSAVNSVSSSSAPYTGWLDGKISGTWTLASSNYNLTPGVNKTMIYSKFVPAVGNAVRLRTKPNGELTTPPIIGNINFN